MEVLSLAVPVSTFKAESFGRRRKGSDLLGEKQEKNVEPNEPFRDSSLRNPFLGKKRLHQVAEKLSITNSASISLDISTFPSLMLSYVNNGSLSQAQSIWDEILNSSIVPSSSFVFELINAYVAGEHFDRVIQILGQLHLKRCTFLADAYKHAILNVGRKGKLEQMETLIKEMTSTGLPVDSLTGNAFLVYYSAFGSISEMEFAYDRLKRSQILIEEQAIRAISSSYIKSERFYSLGKFVEDVGLGRRNVGNLLWNLLLLSYAAKFKMKSLQREFVRMMEGGFRPDITTFNIRVLAFSQMALFWDLHLSLEHMMQHESVNPDLVTIGCVVDCYLKKGLGKNMDFALSKLNVKDCVTICTDEVVFEVMGKGDFHSSSEAFMEFNSRRNWRYNDLITIYQKKILRSNQVFWNY